MKITVLTENTSPRPELLAEHGLSLYIELGDTHILFDAGQTAAFAANAERLGIDLNRVNLSILSHGHYDHGGGLAHFLSVNDHAPVYLSRHAFGSHWNGSAKYIGLDPSLAGSSRLIFTDDETRLSENMILYSCNDRPRPFDADPFGLNRLEGQLLLPEDFRHEQYLLIREGGRRICISGCSHKGIQNILAWFRPDVLIGGLHLSKVDPADPRLAAVARQLAENNTLCYTGHCTGQAQAAALRRILGSRLQTLTTGQVITL